MNNRCLDYIAWGSLLLTALLVGTGIIHSKLWLWFECNEESTTICDYQTALAGLAAVGAALITAFFIRKQIAEGTRNHNNQLQIQNLQFKHSLNYKAFVVSSSFSGEIYSLIKRTQEMNYLESFQKQEEHLKQDPNYQLSAFPISNNYFIVFDSLSHELGLLVVPFPKGVYRWYSQAKGFVDTVIGINEGAYKGSAQLPIVEHLSKELEDLESQGKSLVRGLDLYARDKKEIALHCQREMDRKLEIDVL